MEQPQPRPQPQEAAPTPLYREAPQPREVGVTTVSLTPIAAPSILGLYGFAGATFVVAAGLAGWYTGSKSALFVFPFAAAFGGLAQFIAGLWAYRARDGLATAMHGMWGSFWLGYGILFALFAAKVLTMPTGAFPELGFWFIPLAVITLTGAVAATGVSRALFIVLGVLGLGAAIAAYGFISGISSVVVTAGYVFLLASVAAWWTATGLMFESVFGRTILPLGKVKPSPEVSLGAGEPGVIHGQ